MGHIRGGIVTILHNMETGETKEVPVDEIKKMIGEAFGKREELLQDIHRRNLEDEAYAYLEKVDINDFQLEMEYDSDGSAVATFYCSFEVGLEEEE